MKFRKKIETIDAEKYDGSKASIARIYELMEYNGIKPNDPGAVSVEKGILYLDVYEGKIRVQTGAWIIIDENRNNKLYILPAEDFKDRYERVDYEEKIR